MPGLRGLLVDVGGTLVNDATWLAPDRYRELRLRRMAEALGGERPWFAELVGHAFAEAAMIGDRPERDIAGARGVGMRAIWKRPFDFESDADPSPDATITCLNEL